MHHSVPNMQRSILKWGMNKHEFRSLVAKGIATEKLLVEEGLSSTTFLFQIVPPWNSCSLLVVAEGFYKLIFACIM